MIEEHAQRFAQRMIETWPTGPRRNVWHDIAIQCNDLDALRQAYTDLERTTAHISTAAFWSAYTAAKRKTTLNNPPQKCDECDGTGWLDVTPAPTPDTPAPSGKWKPCRCERGQQMIETRRRILEANRR